MAAEMDPDPPLRKPDGAKSSSGPSSPEKSNPRGETAGQCEGKQQRYLGSHHSQQSQHQNNDGRSNPKLQQDFPLLRGPSPPGRPCRPYKGASEARGGPFGGPLQGSGLDVGVQKMSLRHITLPSMNVIIASMPNSPVAALQYLQCFLETAKKLREEEKAKEIHRQLEFVKAYLRKSQQQPAASQ